MKAPWRVAVHEAGHATIAHVLHRPVSSVWVSAKGPGRGMTKSDPTRLTTADPWPVRLQRGTQEIAVYLVGDIAGSRLAAAAPQPTGWRQETDVDNEMARDLAQWLQPDPTQAERLVAECRQWAEQLVVAYRDQIEIVARALVKRGRISGDDLSSLIGPIGDFDAPPFPATATFREGRRAAEVQPTEGPSAETGG